MTETLLIAAIFAALCVLGMILLPNIQLDMGIFKLGFSKKYDNYMQKMSIVKELIQEHYKTVDIYNRNIINNSQTFAHGKLHEISQELILAGCDKYRVSTSIDLLKMLIKKSLLENGFAGLPSDELQKYIIRKYEEIKEVLYRELGTECSYISSTEFFGLINEIYIHATECVTTWTDKLKTEEIEFNDRYQKLITIK